MSTAALHRIIAMMLVGPIAATNLALAAWRFGFLDAHTVALIAFVGAGVGGMAVIGVLMLARQKAFIARSRQLALERDAFSLNRLPLDYH